MQGKPAFGLLDDLYILAVARSVAVNPFRHAAGDRGFPLAGFPTGQPGFGGQLQYLTDQDKAGLVMIWAGC
ncbi:hypothetical protein [Laribacter hongkongensis]|uniref:hypothetical protein n=1 Tax=Laribacter hongkongensis TaxID=168471 RepID=UPI001EFC4DE8|nr:hypothetical protein [Laribacter hongkongensis]MCG9080476.1 hypothetical protein [Laribacter hongkongensis]